MKCKKALSLLLAAVMTIGMLPVSAMAAPAEKANAQNGTTIEGATTPYVDTTAETNKSYEYTVTGSDGSKQTVTVPAVGAVETGNKITEQTGTGKVYYEKVKDPKTAENGVHLLVYKANNQFYAVNHDPKPVKVIIENDRISQLQPDCEWNLTNDPNNNKQQYVFEGKGKYLKLVEEWWTPTPKVSAGLDGFQGDSYDNQGGFVLRHVGINAYLRGYKSMIAGDWDQSNQFYLYQKVTEPAGTQYTVDTTGLDKLIAEAKTKDKALYEPSTWEPFETALNAANEAKKQAGPYAKREDAEEALAQINQAQGKLQQAMDELVLRLPAVRLNWQRTLEAYNGGTPHNLVTNLQHLDPNDVQKIIWDWSRVRNLTTDPTMTVWDYNTDQQYAHEDKAPKQSGVSAATWNKSYNGSWTDSSVRKFTGTFTWPEGYTMKDSMYIESVNDGNYGDIYKHIQNDAVLNKRFGTSKVIPANDDIYVYVRKANEDPSQWTPEQAQEHLVFWTGTSGKGQWSAYNGGGDDWKRTTPATYQDKPAVPAYHGVYPNNVDVDKVNNQNLFEGLNVGNMKLNHTDGWYTMVGTDTFKSVLKQLYPKGIQGGEQLCLDIYGFDNSETGGMDELQIQFVKAAQTEADVTVEYYVDTVSPGTLIGTTLMSNVKLGTKITLLNGTRNNELNHMKSSAETKVHAQVYDGKQMNEVTVSKDATKNVVKVLYKLKETQATYYTYDFAVENQYEYVIENQSISTAKLEAPVKGMTVKAEKGKAVINYTPGDAAGSIVYATLVVDYGESHGIKQNIRVIPASNVLYEENMMKPSGDYGAKWTSSGAHNTGLVTDNNSTVFGWTAVNQNDTGANGVYNVTLESSGANRFAADLEIPFTGKGFDLIGSCGPNTGTMVVTICKPDGTHVEDYLIDTSYSKGTIYQVPLLHAQFEEGGKYIATVSGAYIAKPAPAAVSTMSLNQDNIPAEAYELMQRMGMTEEEISNVKMIGMEDKLNTEHTPSVSTFAASESVFATQTLSVDGFRVYRSSANSKNVYPDNEVNMTYTNVMADGITGNIAAYIEGTGNGTYDVTAYEKLGGPENEIYLAKDQAIAIQLADPQVATAQISARAVDDTAVTMTNATGEEKQIAHNTEMYYEVSVKDGMVIIGNKGDGLLALGNLKAACGITAINDQKAKKAVEAVTLMFAQPEQPDPEKPDPEQPETFVPAVLDVQASARNRMFGKKQVTVNVTASFDVDKLTVNGVEVKANNAFLVRLGLADHYTYKVTKNMKRSETATFRVVAYDAAGVASETVTVTK